MLQAVRRSAARDRMDDLISFCLISAKVTNSPKSLKLQTHDQNRHRHRSIQREEDLGAVSIRSVVDVDLRHGCE